MPSSKTMQFIEDNKLIDNWYKPSEIKGVPQTHNTHYFEGIGRYKIKYNTYSGRLEDKVHVFREQSDEITSNTEDPEPEAATKESEDETEDFIVRPGEPLSLFSPVRSQPKITVRGWGVTGLEKNVKYVIQVIQEPNEDQDIFKVDYYKAIPLTGNTIFKKCTWPEDIPVHGHQIERLLEPPSKCLRGDKIEFPEGTLAKLCLK